MPAFCDNSSATALSFIDDLILQELSKSAYLNPSCNSSRVFRTLRKERLSSYESLPEDFFDQLVNKYGANGVLLVDIHSYKPYRPISIGVRAKLVDLKSGEFMWAIDETVDGGDASVVVSAINFQRANMYKHYLIKPWEAFYSPRGCSVSF